MFRTLLTPLNFVPYGNLALMAYDGAASTVDSVTPNVPLAKLIAFYLLLNVPAAKLHSLLYGSGVQVADANLARLLVLIGGLLVTYPQIGLGIARNMYQIMSFYGRHLRSFVGSLFGSPSQNMNEISGVRVNHSEDYADLPLSDDEIARAEAMLRELQRREAKHLAIDDNHNV